MKKEKILVLFCMLAAMMLAACGQDQSANVEGTVQSTQTPVIILGDENLTEEAGSTVEPVTETTEVHPEKTEKNTEDASKQEVTSVQGTYLGLSNGPKDATVVESKSYSDGSYTEILSCEEDTVRIHMEKEMIAELDGSIEAVQSRMEEERGWKNTIASADAALSESMGFPVYRFQFSTGEGEETAIHDAVYIVAQAEGFLLDCSTEASEYDKNLELMELWIGSAYIGE